MGSEDILWRKKQKAIREKRSGEWGHLLRKKKTITNKRLWWVRTKFWDEKKSLGNGEWGHTLKIKTKDYQRKKVWWVRTSIERKKRLLQTKDCGEWGHTFGMKKILRKWWVRTYFEEKNKRLSKKKGLVSEDIYWEKKKLIQTKECSEWGHTFGIKKILRKHWVRIFFE